jgi:hypothetical protein
MTINEYYGMSMGEQQRLRLKAYKQIVEGAKFEELLQGTISTVDRTPITSTVHMTSAVGAKERWDFSTMVDMICTGQLVLVEATS